MAIIDQFEHYFSESERAHGRKLYDLGLAVGRSIIPKKSAAIAVGARDNSEYVKIRMLEMDQSLRWSCTCEIYDTKINCRHIWAGLIVAEERSFFQWRFGSSLDDGKIPTFQISVHGPLNAEPKDDYLNPSPIDYKQLDDTDSPLRLKKREALFLLKTQISEFEDWSVQLYYRNCYEDGTRGRWQEEESAYWIEVAEYDPKYRKAIKAYKTAHDNARYEFMGHTFSPDIWNEALLEISKTNAFRYMDEKDGYHNLEFMPSSIENPVELEMNAKPSGKDLKITGALVARKVRVPISKSVQSTNQFVIIDGRLFCANLKGRGNWIEQLKKTPALDIERDDISAFLSSFYAPEDTPTLILPSQYKYKALEKSPKVRLVIERADDKNLSAELEFGYGDEYIDRSEEAYRILDHDRKLIHVRKIRDERDFRNKLFALLERKNYSPGGLLIFKESKLLDLVNSSFDLKWEVVAFKKQVSQMSEYKLKASSGIDWFDLHLDMKFTGGATIPLPDLLRGVKSGKKMVALADGSLGILNDEVIKRFSQLGLGVKIVNGSARLSKAQALYLSSILSDDKNFSADNKFKTLRKVREVSARPTPQQPDPKFKGKLRGYQKKGLGWLDELSKRDIGCLLADDMGLGKTVTILSLLSKHMCGQALIVVPKTLISNWLVEAERFTPHLKMHCHYGSGRRSSKAALANADIVLTTYHTLRSDIDLLKKTSFEFLAIDEAQWIKNPNSDIHKACRLISARKKIALTGTPIENSLGDLFAIFNIIAPGLISKEGWERFSAADDPTVLNGIRQGVAPFILRRRKEDVLKELPPKAVQVLYATLSPSEKRDYNHMKKYLWKTLKGEIAKNGIRQSTPQILTALLRLRQAASHQGLLKKSKEKLPSSKFELLLDLLETIVEENHKVLIFSNFTGVLRLLKRELNKRKIGFCYMDGSTSNRKETVQKFQSDESKKVFLMTIKTGGVGLNLTAASYVFIMDPWWNPATESQAIDRTHRIGQKNKVTAYKLIAKDTVEEKVLALQAKKSAIANAIVEGEASKALKNISEEDLKDLFS